jgi:O-antigen/teichoic acid export membrane protein
VKDLHSKKLISKHIVINLVGNVTPLLFAVLTIPSVIERIGKEKFGLLSIAWLFLGYFSVLDLGIGRATTKFVVDYYREGLVSKLKTLIWTSAFSLAVIGFFMGLVLLLLTPMITSDFLNVPEDLKVEANEAFYLIAISVPFVIGVASLRGVLEAQNRFTLLNLIKIPAGLLNYILPAIVSLYSNSLTLIILLMTLSRVLLLFVYGYYCFKPLPASDGFTLFDYKLVKKLLRYGSWLTVSNIIGPIMVYFDRFLIGSILTLTLLTYYTTPYEVVTKLLIIAGSATTVLFPVFTNLYISDRIKLNKIFSQSVKGLFFFLFPVILFFCFFSNNILEVWIGKDFVTNSSTVFQLLSIGVLLNSLAAIPFTAIQAFNRPDISAKIHLAELLPYLLILIVFARQFGIAGVALAWSLRNLVDAFMFFYFYATLTKQSPEGSAKDLSFLLLFTFSCILTSMLVFEQFSFFVKLFFYAIAVFLFALIFWFKMMDKDEKEGVFTFIKKFI